PRTDDRAVSSGGVRVDRRGGVQSPRGRVAVYIAGQRPGPRAGPGPGARGRTLLTAFQKSLDQGADESGSRWIGSDGARPSRLLAVGRGDPQIPRRPRRASGEGLRAALNGPRSSPSTTLLDSRVRVEPRRHGG